jgi:hypothetical protein
MFQSITLPASTGWMNFLMIEERGYSEASMRIH